MVRFASDAPLGYLTRIRREGVLRWRWTARCSGAEVGSGRALLPALARHEAECACRAHLLELQRGRARTAALGV